MYNGETAKDIANRKGISEKEDILDYINSTELAANLFRITQTDEVLKNKNINNEDDACITHHRVGQAVLPRENVRSRMQILNASIIFYVFDKLNNLKADNKIHNSTNFMISCLYNAITEYYSDSDLQFKIDYEGGQIV